MPIPFDPYHKWLGIPPAEQPPNHYRLLGISLFESDGDVIDTAADQRMGILRSFQTGPHSDLSQKLLNEITAAKLCLIKPDRREKYNATLRPTAEPGGLRPVEPIRAAAPAVELSPPKEPLLELATEPVRPIPAVKPAASNVPVTAVTATKKAVEVPPDPLRLHPPVVPRSAAWDQAVADACAVRTLIPRRKKWWSRCKPSPEFVQFAIGAVLLGGMAYAGLFGFEAWQDTEFKHGSHPSQVSVATGSAEAASGTGNSPSLAATSPPGPGRDNPNGSRFGDATADANNFGVPVVRKPPVTPNPVPLPIVQHPSTSPAVRLGPTPPAIVRSPVPTLAEQQKSLQDLKELLKDDYQQAKGANGQIALAHKLAGLANSTNDNPVLRYVIANQALDFSVKHCDIQLASGLVYGIRTYYEVDGWNLRSKSLAQLALTTKTPVERAEIAVAARSLVEEALADDRPDCAVELATLSMNLSAAVKDFSLREQARELAERSKRSKKWFDAVKAANNKLSTNPEDPDANLVVGKFKSLIKQDWQSGLPYLAKSNDPELRDAVAGEANPPFEPTEEVKLADAWWELAQRHVEPKDDLETSAMRARAVYWYQLAKPSLSGVALLKAQKRTETP